MYTLIWFWLSKVGIKIFVGDSWKQVGKIMYLKPSHNTGSLQIDPYNHHDSQKPMKFWHLLANV